jgi:hypothetical protein
MDTERDAGTKDQTTPEKEDSQMGNERAAKIHSRVFGAAQRRYKVAYMYWCLGWNSREIAEEFK